MASVQIGAGGDNPRSVSIPPFRAFRATYAGLIVGSAFDRLQEVLQAVATYEREYANDNPVRVTREQALARASRAKAAIAELDELLGDEAKLRENLEEHSKVWEDESKRDQLLINARIALEGERESEQDSLKSAEASLRDMGDRAYVEYPGSPEEWETTMVMFTKAMDVMPNELEKLIGLVVITNKDLEDTYAEGGREGLDEKLQDEGRKIQMQGSLEEVLTLMAEAGTVIFDQLEKARSALGKLQALYARATKRKEPEPTQEETPEEPPTTNSTNGSPSSSTSSPDSSTGPDETSSSESLPESSTASSAV